MAKLTEAQSYALRFLSGYGRRPERWFKGGQIPMLREMEESGLVARNMNQEWRITPAGKAALESADE